MMTKRYLTLVFIGLMAASALIALGVSKGPVSWDDPVEQWALIKFSHKLHVEEMEIECMDCHVSVDSSTVASDLLLPKQAQCAECHDEVEDQEQCTLCHTDANRLETYIAPVRQVIFNHKTHVEQEIDCNQCHIGIEKAEAPATAFLPAMATCNTCHDGIENVNSCETCHTNVATLMPLSHKQVDWFKEHKRQVKVGALSNDCAVCHEDNFCQMCHSNPAVQFTRGALTRPLLENRPQPSGGKMLVKQRVHQLNFVFYHAIDFRSKRADCYSCHDQQKFCNECHSKDQDAGFRSPIPFSHRGPDFVRIGVGSGGGRHARLARRDIETCASCHDVEGRDPTCITCHIDRTPGKGNDPRTHRPNFMSDEDGGWHGNPASMCYNCHTNTQRAGIGFCGYCHGIK